MAAVMVECMKRVLFHYPILNVGGAEKSSLRMIKALCDRGWDVTLVLTTGGGALETEVDPRVKLVRLRPRAYGQRFARARGPAAKLRALPDLLGYGAMRLIGGLRMLPFLFHRYDAGVILAISLPTFFMRRFVRSNVRMHWIRNDFDGHFPSRAKAIKEIRKNESAFDHYICVSEISRKSLVSSIPEIAPKAEVVYNILDADAMRKAAEDYAAPFPEGPGIRVLSVCRLKDRSKGLFRMVRLCRRLLDEGHDLVWYIIGDGPDRDALVQAIADVGLQDRMVLLGYQQNPFPAYRDADLVAMMSYYEGLCGIVNEAKVMGCAIIATEVSGVDEQLTDQRNGFVVANEEDAIFRKMHEILGSPRLLQQTRNFDYPESILNDQHKLHRIETLLLSGGRK